MAIASASSITFNIGSAITISVAMVADGAIINSAIGSAGAGASASARATTTITIAITVAVATTPSVAVAVAVSIAIPTTILAAMKSLATVRAASSEEGPYDHDNCLSSTTGDERTPTIIIIMGKKASIELLAHGGLYLD